jgi:hypothetical protein
VWRRKSENSMSGRKKLKSNCFGSNPKSNPSKTHKVSVTVQLSNSNANSKKWSLNSATQI